MQGQQGWRASVVIALSLALGACGGEEEEGVAATTAAGNTAPTITGSPALTANPGVAYSFTPSAADADSDGLVFGIDAKPNWALFNTVTGLLSGTPAAGDVGIHRGIVVWVSDGRAQTRLPAFDLTVMAAPTGSNRAPTISGTPATSTVVGDPYTFVPTAGDLDNQPLTFSIRNRPAWAAFETTTGRLQGTPPSVGTFLDIAISVSDGQVAVPLPSFTLNVMPPTANRAPAISGVPITSVEVGSSYAFVPTASDPDGDELTFAIAGRPSWTSFDADTGQLAGTPPAGTTGSFGNIRISVSDGLTAVALPTFAIAVTPATNNRAPTISGAPATTATQGTAYAFQPTAADADGNTLRFSIANRPTWATFNVNTGALQGTPGAAHIRSYRNIVISVSDGIASTPLPAFSIAVASSNTPPTISGTPPTTGTVGTQYSFTPTASDANGGTLTFSIVNRPTWATFTASTGRLQGTPAAGNVGTFANVRISVSDGQDTTALPAFTIAVSEAGNQAPVLSGAPATAVMQGTAYTFTPTASDPDGDTLTYSITNLPAWAAFDTATGRLSGTPEMQHLGTTTGIVISVSDGELTDSLAAFSLAVQAVATGSATLSWTPPTVNTDGSPLTNLTGYRIYWGPAAGTYPNSVTLTNPGLTSYVVTNLLPGTYFFAATAVNSVGAESVLSNAATKTIL